MPVWSFSCTAPFSPSRAFPCASSPLTYNLVLTTVHDTIICVLTTVQPIEAGEGRQSQAQGAPYIHGCLNRRRRRYRFRHRGS